MHLQGIPNLHGSAVVDGDTSVAFLATSRGGKSTLAAFCALTGSRLVSEEVLAFREQAGHFYLSPGYPQIRLTQDSVELLERHVSFPSTPEPDYDKLRLHFSTQLSHPDACRLRALYLLAPYQDETQTSPCITDLAYQEALPELLRNTLSRTEMERGVLLRHLGFLGRLTERVPVRRLQYPKGASHLPEVRDVVLTRLPAEAGVR